MSTIVGIFLIVIFLVVLVHRVLPWEYGGVSNVISDTTSTTNFSSWTITSNSRSDSCAAGQTSSGGHAPAAASALQGSNPSLAVADTFFLLPTLPLDAQASTNAELVNSTWWKIAVASAGGTIVGMPQSLYWGLLNDSDAWHAYLLQVMPDPPSWSSSGGVVAAVHGQFVRLQSNATSSGNSAVAKMLIWDYVTGISGRGLAGVNFITAGSLTALKVYIETRDPYLALCTTFPGQMAELFANSFDSSIPSDQRAHYFGELLAIAALTTVLAGHDAFDTKLQAVLKDSGSFDHWSTIKPMLADIATIVSSKAVTLILIIAEKVARHFPQDSWAAEYTTFRIDSMVDVLHDAGVPKDVIEEKIAGLAQVADSSGDPEGVGDGADGISYNDGGGIRLVINAKNLGQLSTESGAQYIKASFLEGRVPGFSAGKAAFLKVYYKEAKATGFNYYTGNTNWVPTVPEGVGKPGDILTISVQILTRDDFVNNLPSIDFVNQAGVKWVDDTVQLANTKLAGDELALTFVPDPPYGIASEFSVAGQVEKSLVFNSASGIFLDFHITDVFAADRTLRIYYDGYDLPHLGVNIGTDFAQVYIVSFDGVRLRIAYSHGIDTFQTATLYPVYPSGLYSLSDLRMYALPYQVSGYDGSFIVDNVNTIRDLEHTIAYEGSKNDVGRIGAEIAYTVAIQKLDLTSVIMEDPSQGGPDLHTSDGKVVIEARMLQRTLGESDEQMKSEIKTQLNQMVGRLNGLDFNAFPLAQVGYAVFTYIDGSGIHTIVLEVLKT